MSFGSQSKPLRARRYVHTKTERLERKQLAVVKQSGPSGQPNQRRQILNSAQESRSMEGLS